MKNLVFEKCLYNASIGGLSLNKYSRDEKIVLLVQDKNYHNVKNYEKLEFETEKKFEEWLDSFNDSPYTTTADLNEKLEIMKKG